MKAIAKTANDVIDIAIVGMAARFPGAADVDQFWANLRDGVESIRRLSDEELLAAGVNRAALSDPDYVKASPVLDDVDKFDAAFFGFSARDASVMDPAHRIFLEVAWQAFENAGYTALPDEGPVGVFAAAGAPLYMVENLRSNPELMRSMGEFLVRHTGNDMNFLATRVSYEMDLRGPSLNIQTACSSSLVSVHLACQSLMRGECTMALAGGTTVLVPQAHGYHFKEGEILSPDGHCRPFDAKSAGTVFGSGAGALILKRLSDALDDGDTIHAVIKGSAINNDGAVKVSYLAPGVEGQAAVVGSALEDAGVEADSISYIETHGTGTLVGDPIEVEALNEAYRTRTNRRGYCAIGSVKSNIGHLGEAAGAASLIKAIMALKHRQLPPSLGFETPNPAIDFTNSPFFVNARLRPWQTEGVRRCGVTALGAGGTNCHVILEEAPRPLAGEGDRSQQLIVLSAKTRTALDLASDNLASALEHTPGLDLADAAYTLAVGRRAMPHRRAIAASSLREAVRQLREREPKYVANGLAGEQQPKVVFMFPGGGAQYAGMGRELYDQEAAYRDAIDECLAIIEPALGVNLKALMYPAPGNIDAAMRELERPSLTLPSLFATEYALARLFMAWGVTPQAMIGHSVGEYAAACLSGVMELEDAVKLVLMRGRLFEVVRPGSMLSVPLSEQELRALMPPELDIAAANAPELSVASGPSEAIAKLQTILAMREIDSTPVHINVAAHSSMLDPVLAQFRDLCQTIRFRRPETPFVSNVTGTWISAEQAMSAEYWVSHLRSTVRFADGLSTVGGLGEVVLLEVGPGRTLSMLARAQAQPFQNAFSCIRHPQETASDLGFALTCLGRLWTAGAGIDWAVFYDGQLRNRVPLPSYPFEGKSFWVTPGKTTAASVAADASRHQDLSSWFHTVGYVEAPLIPAARSQESRIWLVLAEDAADAKRLTRAMGHERIVVATSGAKFGERLDGTWRFNFDKPDHYAQIMQYMEESVGLPDHVVLLTGSGATSADRSYFAPVNLLQVLGGLSAKLQVSIVTRGVTGVCGGQIDPVRALALGPVLVGPREFDHIQARCVDLPVGKLSADGQEQLAQMLARELQAETSDSIVALTPTSRWVRHTSALPLPPVKIDAPLGWVREGGVYLVTGGLGGIGLEVAEHLARSRPVKLALMGREALPPEADWSRVLRDTPQGRAAHRIARIIRLRELGAQVLTVRGDVSNRVDVAAAVREVRKAFGPINGVIHGAGVMDDAPMMAKDAAAMRRVLAPKVAGTLALDAEVTDSLDFFLIFSSVASYLGLPGQVDYTAANAFQDAFARVRSMHAKGRTVVINWNAWRDVGMAAAAYKVLTTGLEPASLSAHPALDGYTDTARDRIFVSNFEGEAKWLLAEHVAKGGAAVLPGTAFLELARASYAEGRDAGAIELSNLLFAAPFRAEPGRPRTLTIQVTPSSEGASIAMRAGADLQVQPIVTGEACDYHGPAPAPVDLAAIRARCADRQFAPADQRLDQDFMAFGPRWANIRHVAFGQSEALAEVVLPEPFRGELSSYGLHPALLDMATGGAQALIPGADLSKDFFVPLGYGGVRIFGAMPAQVFSHVRCLPETGSGLACFDVTLADAKGEVFAEISRFTMRRIEASTAFASDRVRPAVVQGDTLAVALRDGIATSEGLEALNRIMAQPGVQQVIASSVDVNGWSEKLRATRVEPVEQEGAVDGFQRPAGAPEYVAPSTGAERVLARIWGDLLGYQSIGVQDNFFDMGGNSLLGVRLFAAIRKKFAVSLPLAVLFEAQTIADLAKLLAEPEQDSVESGAGWSPMVCMKPGAAGRTPVYFIHGSRGNVLVFKAFADRMGPEQPVYALQAAGVDGKMAPDETIEVMAERYLGAILQVQPKGPYMLAGYSGGGVIAYEIARRLKEAGEETSMLMLIDTLEPSQMRTSVTMLDRIRNVHRIKTSRFTSLPGVLWKFWLRRRIRRAMGVKEVRALRTPLELASDAVDAAYKKAQWAYKTPDFNIDAVLIRATDARMHFLRSGPMLGWDRFIKGKIYGFDVDAQHDFVFEGAALSQLVAAFEQTLARLANNPPTTAQVGDAQSKRDDVNRLTA